MHPTLEIERVRSVCWLCKWPWRYYAVGTSKKSIDVSNSNRPVHLSSVRVDIFSLVSYPNNGRDVADRLRLSNLVQHAIVVRTFSNVVGKSFAVVRRFQSISVRSLRSAGPASSRVCRAVSNTYAHGHAYEITDDVAAISRQRILMPSPPRTFSTGSNSNHNLWSGCRSCIG